MKLGPFLILFLIPVFSFGQTCQTIQSQIDSTTPSVNVDGVIRVCMDDMITLSGSGTFSMDGTGATYEWDLGDGRTLAGQSISFSYPDSGIFQVNLNITDNQGCNNTNRINLPIHVSTDPDFRNTTVSDFALCLGESAVINGAALPVPITVNCAPPVSGRTFLPDGSGAVYTTSVTVDCYDTSATITSATDISNICLTMEHSFSGDLLIELVSPNNQSVLLYAGGGGSANLGIPWATGPIDGNSANVTPGTPSTYCFIPGSTNPTFVEGVQAGGIFPDGDGPGTYTDSFIPGGDYRPDNDLSNFIGSPVNGDWTIRVTDQFAADNGYIFEWNLEFDPSLLPTNLSFTPVFVSEAWDTDPTITNITGSEITVEPTVAGNYCYTYRIVDDFGCEYTNEVCIDVFDDPVANPVTDWFVCDDNNDGVAQFNFSLKDTEVLNGQNGSLYDISYHSTEQDAIDGVGGLGNAYNNAAPMETIWARIVNPSNDECFDVTSFVIQVFDTPVALDVQIPLVNCSSGPTAEFNLRSVEDMITNGQPANIVTYYEVLGGPAIANPANYTSASAVIFAEVVDPSQNNCSNIAEVTLVVEPLPERRDPTPLEQCSDTDMAVFDVASVEEFIRNGFDNVTVTFHESFADADSPTIGGLNPIPVADLPTYTSTSTMLFARSEAIYNAGSCHNVSEVALVVNRNPTLTPLLFELCSDRNRAVFNFSDFVVNNPIAADEEITFYYSEQGAIDKDNSDRVPNELNSLNRQLHYRVENTSTTCFSVSTIDLQVVRIPVVNEELSLSECFQNNVLEYGLGALKNDLESTYPDFSFDFYENELDAFAHGVALPDNYISDGTDIFVRITVNNTSQVDCFVTKPVELDIFETPRVTEEAIFCAQEGYVLPDGELVFISGTYIDTIQQSSGCDMIITSEITEGTILFPTAFAPNRNGVNESFRPSPNEQCSITVQDYSLQVWNRWGELVFESNNFDLGWDGQHNGQNAQEGGYIWRSTYSYEGQAVEIDGLLHLIR
ncbi:MAG: gliding motility-associated C-terminal domain-containing protein [Saprospiraceae bacterium]|nr:gliding motility-associated C-terminal domain-containing protein [Saprospiraceae bacterium]